MKNTTHALVENALKADKENFEVAYSDITVVELSKPRLDSWKLYVFMEDLDVSKYTFTIAPPNNPKFIEHFEKFLHTVLPDKV